VSAPPLPHELTPSECRWTCPRSWVRASFASDEPPLLWGQLRILAALDLVALASAQESPPRGVDVQTAGRPGEAVAVAAALSARLEGAVLHPGPVAALRGRGGPGLLADPAVAAVVLDAMQVARTEGAWDAVREALMFGTCAEVAPEEGPASVHRARAQIVMVGPESARKKLRELDAGFDTGWAERVALLPDLPRDRGGVSIVTARIRHEIGLMGPLSGGAMSFLIEQLAGRPARRNRVGLRLDRIGRVVIGARAVQPMGTLKAPAIRRAWGALAWRGGMQEDGHRARVEGGQLQFVTDGTQRGVVNGLMVYGGTDASYCIPGRITARVAVGREGVINIEREAKYSGRSFDKGMFHLAGWLRGTFVGTTHPLGLAASVAFEQSYGKIDGDSATLAETLAILSELSGLPVRQDIALTGAITQRGELLPIGSVNLKVRGWWASCKARGELTGAQGVLIPAASAPDLMVDWDVLQDIRAGRFHVWTADRVEDAAELLLGREAGGGTSRPGPQTVLGLAARKLRAMSERLYPPRSKPATKPAKPAANPAKSKAPTES